MAKRHSNLERLSAGGIFLALDSAMLTGRNIKPDLVFIVDHHAVRPVIDPTLVGIARNVDTARADITAAVLVMPKRRWEFEHVDIAVFVDVVEKCAFFDEFRG